MRGEPDVQVIGGCRDLFYEAPFCPKTFRTNFPLQIFVIFSPKNNINNLSEYFVKNVF
jgi:hypothetical protein